MRVTQQELLAELRTIAESAPTIEDLMSVMVGRLAERMSRYHWVGFYMIEKAHAGGEDVLVLGPFVGEETPHRRIPLHQGICGAAASSGNTIVVDDVSADPRYLACSLETRSEVVAPIRVRGRIVGELDIDSHVPKAFGPDDVWLVEQCAQIVGRYLENNAA